LCPILEESETMITESNSSNAQLSPSSIIIMHEENQHASSAEDQESNSSSASDHQRRQQEKQPLSKKSSIILQEQDVQKTPSDRYMTDDIIGDEERCKRKFAKMVLAANKFARGADNNKQGSRPTHMALLFDVHGNIDMMRMVHQGKSEYHKFCG
jgi:hypothetical protein